MINLENSIIKHIGNQQSNNTAYTSNITLEVNKQYQIITFTSLISLLTEKEVVFKLHTLIQSTPLLPNTATFGTGKKTAVWKMAVKGVIIYCNQENIQDLKISGGQHSTEGRYWGATVII